MISQHTVGFDPADRLAKDPESVRKRFWAKFKRVAARLPFAEDLLSAYYCAFDSQTPRHVQAALLGAILLVWRREGSGGAAARPPAWSPRR